MIYYFQGDNKSRKGSENLTNTDKLNKAINESGLKKKYIAKQLNITYYGLKLKIDNTNEFLASEIAIMCKLLNINSLKEKEEIFFAKERDK
jgi:hypothetical protein